MTVAILAVVQPKPDRVDAVKALLDVMVAASRAEPGCRRYDLYRAQGPDARLHLLEVYDDEAAVAAHRASDHYRAFRAKIGDLLAAPVEVVLLDPLDVRP